MADHYHTASNKLKAELSRHAKGINSVFNVKLSKCRWHGVTQVIMITVEVVLKSLFKEGNSDLGSLRLYTKGNTAQHECHPDPCI